MNLFIALIGRLFYLQIIKGAELQAKAADQWMRELPLKAARGKVYDAAGRLLVTNRSVYTVYVRPKAVADAAAVAGILSEVLEYDYDRLLEKVNKKGVSEVTIAANVEKEAADKLKAAGLSGIYLAESVKRNYPYGDFMTQVLGYTNADGDGQEGLEAYYNKHLKGVSGYSLTQTDIQGRELEDNITQYIPSIPGCDVTVTVDYNVQAFCEAAMEKAMVNHQAANASAIVMDAQTGAILAMTTKNSFDLNAPPRDDVAALLALGKNKMVTDVYEPGSTFKIFTIAAALEEEKVRLSESFYCPGYRVVDGQRIRCWRTIGHGSQGFGKGINNSCNCVFMDLALRLGVKDYYGYLNKFGFGQRTGIDAYSESRGIVMPEKTVKTVDLARIGFGQAIAVTPLQMVAGVAAVVNGGKLYQPYLVSEIRDYQGNVVQITNPTQKKRVLSTETSAVMRELLEDVVANGSGKNSYIPGYRIGGKTGTAQKFVNGALAQGKYVSSFIGFAPADNPKYVTLVTIDEPVGAYYGSVVAAPYVREIYEKLFAYMGLQPNLAPDEEQAAAVKVEMPYIVGLTVAEAMTALDTAGLQYEIDGTEGRVIEQMPPAGTEMDKGAVVLFRLEK